MAEKALENLYDRWPSAAIADLSDRLRSPRGRSAVRAGVMVAAFLLVAAYVYLLLWHDTAISTHWLPDTLYIMNAAWTVHEGFVPNVDFTDRYGGLLTRLISFSMSLSCPSMKALDVTLAILLVGCSAMLAVVWRRRLGPISGMAALLVVAALIVTRSILEQPFMFKAASYATIYNRLSWVMLFLSYIVATVPRARGSNMAALAVAGFATAVMLLTKISFGLALPAIVAGFLLRDARRDCIVWIAATLASLVLFWIAFGMGPAAWLRLLNATAHLGDGAPRGAGLVKLGYLLLYNSAAVAAIMVASFLLVINERARSSPLVATTMLMLGLSFGVAVTTGHLMLYETTSPAMAMMAVAILAHLERRHAIGSGYWFPLGFCILGLALPHLANGAWTGSRRTDMWGIRTNDAGPLNTLSIRPAQIIRPRETAGQLTGADLPEELRTFHSLNRLSDQDMVLAIRDGVRQLVQLPGYKSLGILSPGERVFPFLLGSKPIRSVDHWLTPAEFAGAPDQPLPADIDVIAVVRWELLEELPVTNVLLPRARRDFTLCRQSALWNIYLRRSPATRQAARGCTTSGWAMPVPAI